METAKHQGAWALGTIPSSVAIMAERPLPVTRDDYHVSPEGREFVHSRGKGGLEKFSRSERDSVFEIILSG